MLRKLKLLKQYLFTFDISGGSVFTRFTHEDRKQPAVECIWDINGFTLEEIRELEQLNGSYVSKEWLLRKGFMVEE